MMMWWWWFSVLIWYIKCVGTVSMMGFVSRATYKEFAFPITAVLLLALQFAASITANHILLEIEQWIWLVKFPFYSTYYVFSSSIENLHIYSEIHAVSLRQGSRRNEERRKKLIDNSYQCHPIIMCD